MASCCCRAKDRTWAEACSRRLDRAHLAGITKGEVDCGDDAATTEFSLETGRKTVVPKNLKISAKHLAQVDEELKQLTLLTLDDYIGLNGLERTML